MYLKKKTLIVVISLGRLHVIFIFSFIFGYFQFFCSNQVV